MVGTKTLICGVWLCGIWLSWGSAHADGQAARWSLRMRPADGAHARRADKRVGQVPGAPNADAEADEDADADAAPPDEAPPVAAPAPAPMAMRPRAAPPVFASPPSDAGWQVIDDDAEDRAARQRARSPGRFLVTGSLIERAT